MPRTLTESNLPLDADRCWQAVLAHDSGEDGAFYYGVLTTGVYCRPSCPSRNPKRDNVRFYATPAEAERDGLRACLRCRPLSTLGVNPARERILELCRYIERHAGSPLTLSDLSRRAKLSEYHLQRSFKAVVGVTPKQYLEGCRLRGFKSLLRSEDSVTDAIFEAGFGSLSRVYEKVDTQMGMTPIEYRSGGVGLEITWACAQTALGLMMLGATDRGLCFLQFGEREAELLSALRAEYPKATISKMQHPPSPQFQEWMSSLDGYLAGHQPDWKLPLHVRASAFQMKVWKYLQSIPYGSTRSYSEVAAAIGQPGAARAVARACASNRVALAIPCHRVIRGTGEPGGYRWGLDRQRALLERERHAELQSSQ